MSCDTPSGSCNSQLENEEPYVLWLTSSYPCAVSPVGGIFHKTMVDALTRVGVRVLVAAPAPWVPPGLKYVNGRYRVYSSLPRTEISEGVTVLRPRYPALPRELLWAYPHLTRSAAVHTLRLPRPSLIHAHFAYQGTAALQLARKWRVPVVLTLHGSDVNQYPYLNRVTRRRFIQTVRATDALIAVSEALAARTQAIAGRQPGVIPIGVDLRNYQALPGKEQARRRLQIPSDQFVILYIGNLVAAKGLDELLTAVQRLGSGVTCAVVGDGPIATRARKTRNVVTYGVQPNTRIPEFLRAADVLVLPSYSEGLPTVVVEAGAAGTPVIATGVGGIPEILRERGYLIEPHSVDALVCAVEHVRGYYSEALRKAAALQDYIRQSYDADVNARVLGQIYQRFGADA